MPCIKEWIERRRDKRRKAGVERVARVKGRNMRICKTVERLEKELGRVGVAKM